MKPYIFILSGLLFSAVSLFGQNETDALRYSQQYMTGTARSVGLGGAIGAVGADFASLSINPAGIGLYRQSEFSISPSIYWNKSEANFLGNITEETEYNFNFGNIGYVMNYNFNKKSGLVSASIGFGYNRMNNFHSSVFMSGNNYNSSLLDNFTNNINQDPNDLNPFYEQIAYDANLVPEDIDNPGEYFNDIENAGYGQIQRRVIDSYGSVGEYLISFGANISNVFYLGASLGIDRVNYHQDIRHIERDPDDDIIPVFNRFVFYENLDTRGTGVNMKFGVIARPANFIRIGAAYHIPTFYSLNDVFTTDISSSFDLGYEDYDASASSPLGEFEYDLRTPGRFIGSVALTFGQTGMLSADYEYTNYSDARLDAFDYDFIEENNEIQNLYGATHNIRLGGELRSGPLYFRGGYSFYQSPYVTNAPDIKPNMNVFSGGLGIRNKYFFMDLSYSLSAQESEYYMYVPEMTNGAVLNEKKNSVLLSMGFRF